MATLNSITIIGNVGREPETRTVGDGLQVTTLSVATSDYAGKDQAGEPRYETNWHTVVCWGRLAESAARVAKGEKVFAHGEVRYSTSEGKDGTTRYWTEIKAQRLVRLGGRDHG